MAVYVCNGVVYARPACKHFLAHAIKFISVTGQQIPTPSIPSPSNCYPLLFPPTVHRAQRNPFKEWKVASGFLLPRTLLPPATELAKPPIIKLLLEWNFPL